MEQRNMKLSTILKKNYYSVYLAPRSFQFDLETKFNNY